MAKTFQQKPNDQKENLSTCFNQKNIKRVKGVVLAKTIQNIFSKPHFPKGNSIYSEYEEKGNNIQENEANALFSVIGMTCSACAASVENAIKKLPGIKLVVIDVLNNKAQVIFNASLVYVSFATSLS